MPALEALLGRFHAANTAVLGVSVDSLHSHANWAVSMGGISFPLLADFHPKGAIGSAYGVYVDAAGLNARATVIIDASGVVQFAEMADGQRDMEALAARCEDLNAGFAGDLVGLPRAPGLAGDAALYVKNNCGFSTAALLARSNLHLDDKLRVQNVSEDAAARARLEDLSGGATAPCLVVEDEPLHESEAIIEALADAFAPVAI